MKKFTKLTANIFGFYTCPQSFIMIAPRMMKTIFGEYGSLMQKILSDARVWKVFIQVSQELVPEFFFQNKLCIFRQARFLKLDHIYKLNFYFYVLNISKFWKYPRLSFFLCVLYPSQRYQTINSKDVPYPKVEAILMNFPYHLIKVLLEFYKLIKRQRLYPVFNNALTEFYLSQYWYMYKLALKSVPRCLKFSCLAKNLLCVVHIFYLFISFINFTFLFHLVYYLCVIKFFVLSLLLCNYVFTLICIGNIVHLLLKLLLNSFFHTFLGKWIFVVHQKISTDLCTFFSILLFVYTCIRTNGVKCFFYAIFIYIVIVTCVKFMYLYLLVLVMFIMFKLASMPLWLT